MELIEIILLICAYSLLIISIFLQFVCYKRNLEFIETMLFTISLLLLIIAISVANFFPTFGNEKESANLFVLVAMLLVGVTTPINVLKERQHSLSNIWNKFIIGFSFLLLVITFIGYFKIKLFFIQYLIIGFLVISVMLSMLLIRNTNPIKRYAHREKIERIIAILFMLIVPLCLIVEFRLGKIYQFNIGFLLPITFIILSGSKIWDDLERLSLFKTSTAGNEQNLKNYALTTREKEIAILLTKGMTYKQIAAQLFISMPTVKTHVTHIYKKCNVNNKNELIYLLISN